MGLMGIPIMGDHPGGIFGWASIGMAGPLLWCASRGACWLPNIILGSSGWGVEGQFGGIMK